LESAGIVSYGPARDITLGGSAERRTSGAEFSK
jgi:hypothetical protein